MGSQAIKVFAPKDDEVSSQVNRREPFKNLRVYLRTTTKKKLLTFKSWIKDLMQEDARPQIWMMGKVQGV